MIATIPRLITAADVAQAEFDARVADDRAASAWDRVEAATADALILEARAVDAHELVRRLRFQIGFRRVN